jgi:hypothetical protein
VPGVTRTTVCSHDIYASKKVKPRKPAKLRDQVEDNAGDVEYISASARLTEAVEILRK